MFVEREICTKKSHVMLTNIVEHEFSAKKSHIPQTLSALLNRADNVCGMWDLYLVISHSTNFVSSICKADNVCGMWVNRGEAWTPG